MKPDPTPTSRIRLVRISAWISPLRADAAQIALRHHVQTRDGRPEISLRCATTARDDAELVERAQALLDQEGLLQPTGADAKIHLLTEDGEERDAGGEAGERSAVRIVRFDVVSEQVGAPSSVLVRYAARSRRAEDAIGRARDHLERQGVARLVTGRIRWMIESSIHDETAPAEWPSGAEGFLADHGDVVRIAEDTPVPTPADASPGMLPRPFTAPDRDSENADYTLLSGDPDDPRHLGLITAQVRWDEIRLEQWYWSPIHDAYVPDPERCIVLDAIAGRSLLAALPALLRPRLPPIGPPRVESPR